MKKIFVITRREYFAAVRSKAFVISLVLLPLMMLAGVVSQRLTQKMADTSTYRVALIDRSPQGTIGKALLKANDRRERKDVMRDGKQVAPRFQIESVAPAARSDISAIDQQRLKLSQRVERGELLAFVEIGENVGDMTGGIDMLGMVRDALTRRPTSQPDDLDDESSVAALTSTTQPLAAMEKAKDENIVRYTTNRPTFQAFRGWLQQSLLSVVMNEQFRRLRIDPSKLNSGEGIRGPIVLDRGMARAGSNGEVSYESNKASAVTSILLPVAFVALMMITVMVGASPLTTNVIEEKQQRVAEVLLGSVTPFELMMGKLLGGVAVTMTLAAIYFAGIVFTALQYDVLQYVQPSMVAWFILFSVLATLLYGSIFTMAGASVTNIKEAQAIITPVVLLVSLPLFVFSVVLEYPNGVLARTLSYFPLTAPMGTVIRMAIPPGLPWWELTISVASSLLGTAIMVWIAGRVFRVGMLMSSRPASIGEFVRWLVRG
ncbi:MAG: ABC transporter permease [Tepidisphaeraceae bacterium]